MSVGPTVVGCGLDVGEGPGLVLGRSPREARPEGLADELNEPEEEWATRLEGVG